MAEVQETQLTNSEERKIEERAAIGAHIVLAAVRKEGDQELSRTSSALAWSGLAAGLSMGFSFIAEVLLRNHLPDQPWRPLLAKLGYCVGFLIVVLGRQQLFTENTLTVMLPLLRKRDMHTLSQVARLWLVVLAANLFGTFLFALFVARSGAFDPAMLSVMRDAAREAVPAGFAVVYLKAIFAGWLIALMVWLLPAAESARVSIIVIITYLVGLGTFPHIIAGSTKVMFAALTGVTSWPNYWFNYMIPALLGNITGGSALVAALGHAQAHSNDH